MGYGVSVGTLVSDLQYLLREGFITLKDLEICGFVRAASIEALDAIAGRKKSTIVRKKGAISKWATVLLNHFDGVEPSYSEEEAFAEAALIYSGIYVLKKHAQPSLQGSFPFAATAVAEKRLDPEQLVEYAVCTHPKCLRALEVDSDYQRCPRSHGRPEFVESPEQAVGLLGEHVLLNHLKQVAKELNLPRMEYLSQGQAFRGVAPSTRKRPDFIVWNSEGEEFWIDAKVHLFRNQRVFVLRREDVVIMTRWTNPRVVFFERTGTLEFPPVPVPSTPL